MWHGCADIPCMLIKLLWRSENTCPEAESQCARQCTSSPNRQPCFKGSATQGNKQQISAEVWRAGRQSRTTSMPGAGHRWWLGMVRNLQVWPKGNLKEADYQNRSHEMWFLLHQKNLLTSDVSVPWRFGWSRMVGEKSWEFSLTNTSFQSHTPAVRIILWMGRARLSFLLCSASTTIQKKQAICPLSCCWKWRMRGGESDPEYFY